MPNYKRSRKANSVRRRSNRLNPSNQHGPGRNTHSAARKQTNGAPQRQPPIGRPASTIAQVIRPSRTGRMRLDCVMVPSRKRQSVRMAQPVTDPGPEGSPNDLNNPPQANPAEPAHSQPPNRIESDSQVFRDGFKTLSSLPTVKMEELINSLDIQPADVDKWEIALHPDIYLQQFGSPLATVTLSSHVPKQKSHPNGTEPPYYEDFMLLAASSHQIWVESRFKDPFFAELQQWRLIQPSKVKFQSAYGNAHIPVIVFIHCLKIAQCETLRIRQYGQKLPMVPQFTMAEPAEINHPLSEQNEWDIGITVKSKFIWLFYPAAMPMSKSTQVFPICIPASGDYGSVSFVHKHRGQPIRIKVYPRIVHAIKSFNSRIQGERPKTNYGMRAKAIAIQKVLQQLAELPADQLGGFRMEVSIQAKTLQQARTISASIPFLVPSFWFNPSAGFARFKLEAKFVTKAAYLANSNWVYQQAVTQKAFHTDDSLKPTPIQQRMLSDCYSAMGWNSGYTRITQSHSTEAWWTQSTLSEDSILQSDIIQELLRHHSSHESKSALINKVRAATHGGFIPCRKDLADPAHRYHLVSKETLRMRCYHQNCKDNMPFEQAIVWFANLLSNGFITATSLGLSASLTARLNQFVPNPEHQVPFAIPPVTSLNRIPLSPAWYSTNWTAPNGNCMFEAFGKAFAGSLLTPSVVRAKAVAWMAQHRNELNQFTIQPDFGSFDQYLTKMAQFGTWGDSIVLHALCSYYQVKVQVLKLDHSGNYVWLPAGDTQFERTIYLFLANNHYENLLSAAEVARL